jgi:hypothetical protein
MIVNLDSLEIDPSPAHDAVLLAIRPDLDDLQTAPVALPTSEAWNPPSNCRRGPPDPPVEAMDPVTQRLAVHAGLSCSSSVHPVPDRRQGQKPPALVHVLRPPGQRPKALQPTIAHPTRSSLHRLSAAPRRQPIASDGRRQEPRRTFKTYPIGVFHIDIAEVQTRARGLRIGLVDELSDRELAGAVDRDEEIELALRRKLVSTRAASATVSVFFAGRFLWTQSAASPSDSRSASSTMSCSRGGLLGPRLVREGRKLGSLRFEAALTVGTRSAEDDGAREAAATAFAPLLASRSIFAFRSGSRSSSAAMPARAKRA